MGFYKTVFFNKKTFFLFIQKIQTGQYNSEETFFRNHTNSQNVFLKENGLLKLTKS